MKAPEQQPSSDQSNFSPFYERPEQRQYLIAATARRLGSLEAAKEFYGVLRRQAEELTLADRTQPDGTIEAYRPVSSSDKRMLDIEFDVYLILSEQDDKSASQGQATAAD